MKKINIKFLFFNDKVCGRCKTTDDFLDEALTEFKQKNPGVEIIVKREKLLVNPFLVELMEIMKIYPKNKFLKL